MEPIHIQADVEKLHVRAILRAGYDVTAPRRIIWVRHGERRAVPSAMLRDTIAAWEAWAARPKRWTEAPPIDLGFIAWDHAIMLPVLSLGY